MISVTPCETTSSLRFEMKSTGLALIAALATLPPPSARQQPADRYWPQWRGPNATGVSRTATPPTEWSESKNIRWKVEIPGRGSGAPMSWGDRIDATSAVPAGVEGAPPHATRGAQPRIAHKYVVFAIDRKTGKTIWERNAR